MAVRGILTDADIRYTTGKEGAAISGLLQRLIDLAEGAGGPAPLPHSPDTTHLQDLQALAGNQQFRAVAQAAAQLRQDLRTWTSAANDRIQRGTAWLRLDQFLDHASSLSDTSELRSQRDAVLAYRLLLRNPDPVAPLIDQITALLRRAAVDVFAGLRSAYESEVASLKASGEWDQLSKEQQESVFAEVGLVLPNEPDISGTDELLVALNEQPLKGIGERIQALPAKGVAARRAIAEIIDPEPKVSAVSPPLATLKSEADVDNFLADFRTKLMEHIVAGETVIT